MSSLDRYLSTSSDIHPFWLLAPAVACAVLIIWLNKRAVGARGFVANPPPNVTPNI